MTVIGSTVIGCHHPAETEVPAHERVHGGRVNGITAENWRRRVLGLIPAHAEAAVYVMITGNPLRALALGIGRQYLCEGGRGEGDDSDSADNSCVHDWRP